MNNDVALHARVLTNLTTAALVGVSSLVQKATPSAAGLPSPSSLPLFSVGFSASNASKVATLHDFPAPTSSTGIVGGLGVGSSTPGDQPAWLPASVTMARGACLIVFSVLGAGFNTFMIVAIAPNRRLRTVRNILLVHLGAVGLLSSMFTTAYPAIATFHGHWLGGRPMCQTYAYVTCVFTSVSVWTIAALSWDKYQTIASPLHHSLTASLEKMVPCFLAFWVCGLLLSLPPLLGANEFVFHTTMGICGVNHSSWRGRWYTCLLVAASFGLPFCLMIYCYAHIFRIARTQSSRIAATMLRMVSVIQAPIAAPAVSSSQGSNSLSLRGTKAMGTILQLIGSFVLTYLPYSIIVLYEVVFAEHANAVFVSIATTLFLAAPFTHAAIYGLRNQILRTSFYRYTRRKYQDFKSRRGTFCCLRCCRGSHRDKRRGSVRILSGQKQNQSVSYVKRGSIAPPNALRCVVKADGRQYVLRRTMSYQEPDYGNNPCHPESAQGLPQGHEQRQNMAAFSAQHDAQHNSFSKNSIPRPHSYSDGFRNNSIVNLGNINSSPACYPTSPLLLHSNSNKTKKAHGQFGYSSVFENFVGSGILHNTNMSNQNSASGIDEFSSYHIPNCSERRSRSQAEKSDISWRENSVFGKDLLEEMEQMGEELDSISRADEVQDTWSSHAEMKTSQSWRNCNDKAKRDSWKHNRTMPFNPPTSPLGNNGGRTLQEITRSKLVRNGLIVKLSQLTSNQKAKKKLSFGSAGSRGLGSVEDSSIFEVDYSPDTEAKSSVFGSCQLNDLDSVLSLEEREKDSIFECPDELELSNFELESDHIMHIVSSQV